MLFIFIFRDKPYCFTLLSYISSFVQVLRQIGSLEICLMKDGLSWYNARNYDEVEAQMKIFCLV